MLSYDFVIIDECGYLVALCEDYTDSQIKEMLENHVEWSIACRESVIE